MPNLSLRLFAAVAVLLCSACMDAADQAGNSRVTLTSELNGVECRVILQLPNAHWDPTDRWGANQRRGINDDRSVLTSFYFEAVAEERSATDVLYRYKRHLDDEPTRFPMVQVIDESILYFESTRLEHDLDFIVWKACPDLDNGFVKLRLDYPLSSDGDEATQQRRREEYEAEALKILGSADFQFTKS